MIKSKIFKLSCNLHHVRVRSRQTKNDITTKWFICLPHFSAQKRVRIPSVIRGIFRSKMAPIGEKDERMGSTLADDDENESQTLWYLLRSIVLLIDICKISSSLLSPALYFWNSGVASHLQLIIIYRGKIIVFISNKLIVYFHRIDLKLYILPYDTIPINLQSSFYLNDYPSSSFLNNTTLLFSFFALLALRKMVIDTSPIYYRYVPKISF